MMNAPTITNNCELGAEAASQIVKEGGTMLGQMPTTSPTKPSRKKHSDNTNGATSRLRITAIHSATALRMVRIGTGDRYQKFGQVNQRVIRCELTNGSHALTSSMNAITPSISGRVRSKAMRCTRPSVLRISQVAPSNP